MGTKCLPFIVVFINQFMFFFIDCSCSSFYVMLFPNICYYVCVCVCVHPLGIPSNSEECQYTVILRFIFPLNFIHIEFVA